MKGTNTVVNFCYRNYYVFLVLRGAHYFPRCSGESKFMQKGIEMYVCNKCPTLGYKVWYFHNKKKCLFFFSRIRSIKRAHCKGYLSLSENQILCFSFFSKILKISYSRGPGKSTKFSNLCCMSKRFLAYRVEFFYRRFSEKTLRHMFKHPWEFILTWLVWN